MKMNLRRILVALLFVIGLGMGITSCAPKAQPIQGDIAQAVEAALAHGTGTFDHSKFDAILKRDVHLEQHQFDYADLKSHEADLDAYLNQMAQADIRNLSRDQLMALLINAYNAYTIKSILSTMTPDHPQGVASIRDIPNVFDSKTHRVGKSSLSLNNIEHNILRPYFKDPRIHFAVNCASASCPPLANAAYIGEQIDPQLDAAVKRALQSNDYLRVENDHLLVTKLLDWYGSDFVTPGYRGAAPSLPEYLERYASEPVKQFVAAHRGKVVIQFMSYDWSLNRVR